MPHLKIKMDSIYHETQVGQLCAQHCLNNLLQGSYYDPVQLADIANKLDEAEKAHLTEGDISTSQMLKVMEKPSTNMDDSGFFSVQVISAALKVFNLDITTSSAPRMKYAMENPVGQKAFICNHELHWITIRKLGRQWFNLDSLKKGPELISDTYLSLFLTQLQMEGYSIFVVTGNLPPCEADELLTLVPIETKTGSSSSSSSTSRSSHLDRPRHNQEPWVDTEESEQLDLAKAISASLADQQSGNSGIVLTDQEQARQKRLQYFNDRSQSK